MGHEQRMGHMWDIMFGQSHGNEWAMCGPRVGNVWAMSDPRCFPSVQRFGNDTDRAAR